MGWRGLALAAGLMLPLSGCARTPPDAVEAEGEGAQPAATASAVAEPEVIPLWPGRAPGAVGDEPADRPTLTIFLPEESAAVPTGVIVCPGGSYRHLSLDREGRQVARLFTSHGIAAFVLTYRLGPRYRHPAMLQDVLQAIRVVRHDASRYGIRPDRIGVIGFSAGGHLASSAATLFGDAEGRVAGASPDVSARPDFAILAYPVIVMGDRVPTHHGSQVHLLGPRPSPALIARLSTDRQVTPETPPTFLFHTTEDTGVPPDNSLRFYQALRKAGVPAELHVYERGRHGVALAPDDPVLGTWPDRMLDWLRVRGVL